MTDSPVEAFEIHEFDDNDVAGFRELEPQTATLLREEDVEHVSVVLEPGSAGAVLVWENAWAARFASALRRSCRQLVASGRIRFRLFSRPRIRTPRRC